MPETVTLELWKLELHDILVGLDCMRGNNKKYEDYFPNNFTHVELLHKKLKDLYDKLPEKIGNVLKEEFIISKWDYRLVSIKDV